MAKAEPISNGGSTIGDNVFKKKKLLLYKKIIVAREKRSKNMREEQLYRHQVQWRRRGRRCSKCWSKDSPAAHDADHDETDVSVKPMEIHRGADIHCSPWRTPFWRRWMPERRMWPRGKIVQHQAPDWTSGIMKGGVHIGEGFLARLLTHFWSSPILKDCMLWKAPMLEQLMKNWAHGKD